MRPTALFAAVAALLTAFPALAEPVVVAGSQHAKAAAARQPDCLVQPGAASAAQIRCRVDGGDAGGFEATEFRVLVSVEGPPQRRACNEAQVVRPAASRPAARPARIQVIHGDAKAACGA